MKQTIALLAILSCFGAHAGGKPPTQHTSPQPTAATTTTATATSAARGTGVGVGIAGGGAGGAGGSITGLVGVNGGTFGGAGGLGGTGGSIGNVLAGGVDLAGARIGSGDLNVARQTPPSYAPPASAPPTSCRLVMGGGGADDKVSLSLGIPIGNDAICLHKKKDALMQAANARKPNTFSEDDFLRNDCTVEGMNETSACRAMKERDTESGRATAALEGRLLPPRETTASLNLMP